MENNKNSLLSRWKNRDQKGNTIVEKNEIEKIPDDISIPLSREQKRIWFLQQLNPNNSFYNYAELYDIKGDLNINLFEKSIRIIEENHDVLRSNFKVIDGKPYTEINNSDERSDFLFYDYSLLERDVAISRAKQLFFENSKTIFDLSKGALLRTILIKISENNFLFSIVLHHIITDEWAMRIFRKELASIYKTLKKSQEPQIQKAKIQYGSYAYWQQNRPININHLNYWKNKLSGEIPTLNLPFDFNRKPQPTYKGTFDAKKYDEKTSIKFFNLCKELEATPYVVMLSIYYVLLQKYSQQDDILIGTSITKRNQESLEKLMGFFNDTVIIRTKIDNRLTFSEFVKIVKQVSLEAFSNDSVSFDNLVKKINPNRSLSVNPFFQTMFLYSSMDIPPALDEGISYTNSICDMGGAKFDLTFEVSEEKGILNSLFIYATDLFEKKTIQQMHSHFEILLNEVIENPVVPLFNIEIETKKEKDFFSILENPNISLGRTYKGIHDFITHQANININKEAVVFKGKKISYSELEAESNKVAFKLIQQGIKKNDIVGLCIERSHKMIIGLIGILKAGAAYLPLDPKYPKKRIEFILEDSNSKALLTENNLLIDYKSTAITINNLDVILEENIDENLINLPEVEENDLAYVIYTSGSTGTPKGVAISHKNIINSTLARSEFYLKDPSVFLLMSSISFDSSKAGIFWTLCAGGSIVISEDKLEQDLDKLSDTIEKYKVSHTLMLPSLYQVVMNLSNSEKLRSLKTVIVAGEACSSQLIQNHFEKLPHTELYNEYGPTEGTVWCIAHKFRKEDGVEGGIPIGKPIANTKVYILDKFLKKVPYGTSGELHIGGENLSSGYLNNIEKTEAVFIDNPFKPGERLYKTGDLVKLNNDGAIIFLGRKDQQVKVRGYRIELDEIEQQIYMNPNIKSAVVTVESNEKEVDWGNISNSDDSQLISVLNQNFSSIEVEQLVESIDGLMSDSELDILLENI